MPPQFRLLFVLVAVVSTLRGQPPEPAADKISSSSVDALVQWLLEKDQQLREIPFREVILSATGKHVLSVDGKSEVDQRVIKQIGVVLDEAMKRMIATENAA